MPHVNYSVDLDGLSLSLMFGLNGRETARLVAAGQPIPAPILVRGIVDTGSDITSVASHALQNLGLAILQRRTTQTAGGRRRVKLYEASLSIPRPGHPASPLFVMDQLVIMELANPPTATCDALLGLDIVLQLLLFLNGPRREFLLGD